MSDVTEIYLARHGETDWNAVRRFQGQTEIALNQRGQRQAERLATRMHDVALAAIYASDLSRAVETAAPSARQQGLEVIKDARLRERHYGAFEGHLYAEVMHEFPDLYRGWQERDPQCDLGGGESLRQLAARCEAFLDEIALKHQGQTILIVTHGGVLDLAYRHVKRLPLEVPRDWETPNAALNHVRFQSNAWHLMFWADREHLDR